MLLVTVAIAIAKQECFLKYFSKSKLNAMKKFFPAWHLIYTKTKQENRVASQLSEDGTVYLLPKEKVVRQWHDRKQIMDRPLFPSYIFVFIEDITTFYRIKHIEGVYTFVKFGNEYATVCENVIDNIRLITNNGSNVCVYTGTPSSGQKMTIINGPLCGLIGEVHKVNNRRVVCVRVNLLNRVIFADIPSTSLILT